MSPTPQPTLREPVAPLPPAPTAAESDRPSSASWPNSLTVSTLLMLGLVAALSLPALSQDLSLVRAALLALPVIASAVVVRWTFESRLLATDRKATLRRLMQSVPPTALGLLAIAASLLVVGLEVPLDRMLVAAVLVPALLVLAATLRAFEVRYLLNSRRVFFVGTETQRADLAREVRQCGDIALAGSRVTSPDGSGVITPTGFLEEIATSGATMLVVSSEAMRSEPVVEAASGFHGLGGRVRDLSGFYERHFGKIPLAELTPAWFLFDVAEVHRAGVYGAVKRVIECVVAATLLAVLLPLIPLIALAIVATSRGPLFYRQVRVGKDDVPFVMLKFRTMTVAGNDSGIWATADQARVTAVGRLLRRVRLDEVPQLWNVLAGQLSLVGPRPEQVPLVRRLEESIPFYAVRHRVRPGLTGWAQVNYGYGGSHTGTMEKLQYDFYYLKNQSIRLDLFIMASTLRAIVRGGGA